MSVGVTTDQKQTNNHKNCIQFFPHSFE